MGHIRPLVKYHGGKGRLHQWIISQMPSHRIYIEPFGGAGSVLFNKPPSTTEVYSDIEPQMANLIWVVQNDFYNFYDKVAAVSYTKSTFLQNLDLLQTHHENKTERAAIFYIVKRMSRGGLCERFSWSSRIYSRGPAEEHCWHTSLENLKKIHERIQNVIILNKNVFDIIGNYLHIEDCLVYLDPPYLATTRVLKKAYDFEFGLDNHERLAHLLTTAKAKVILSGYDSHQYQSWYSRWHREIKDVGNHSSQHNRKSKIRKQEVLWMNYTPSTN